MRFKPAILSVLAATALAPAAMAADGPSYKGRPVLLSCELTENGRTHWIPRQVFILKDAPDGFRALDSVGHTAQKDPVPAKLAVDNAYRQTYSWTVEIAQDRELHYVSMAYRMTVPKDGSKVSISGKALGHVEEFFGTGSCRRF